MSSFFGGDGGNQPQPSQQQQPPHVRSNTSSPLLNPLLHHQQDFTSMSENVKTELSATMLPKQPSSSQQQQQQQQQQQSYPTLQAFMNVTHWHEECGRIETIIRCRISRIDQSSCPFYTTSTCHGMARATTIIVKLIIIICSITHDDNSPPPASIIITFTTGFTSIAIQFTNDESTNRFVHGGIDSIVRR